RTFASKLSASRTSAAAFAFSSAFGMCTRCLKSAVLETDHWPAIDRNGPPSSSALLISPTLGLRHTVHMLDIRVHLPIGPIGPITGFEWLIFRVVVFDVRLLTPTDRRFLQW